VAKASREDLQQMFVDSVCIHKNKPYYVHSIDARHQALCTNLVTQEREKLPINEESFIAPTQRLGYVNIHGGVAYTSRKPIRRYKAGISGENFNLKLADVVFAHGSEHAKAVVETLTSKELGDCILGKYPKFKDAVERVLEGADGAVAFDRQFAITTNMQILYKNYAVGYVKRSAKTVKDIIFSEQFEHLATLLDGNYEKTVSGAGSQ